MARARRRRIRWARVAAIAVALLLVAAFAFWLSLPSVDELREGPPRSTALIDARAAQAKSKGKQPRRVQQWVSLSRISPWLQRAVVDSEDARFFVHDGIDRVETEKVIEAALEKQKLGRGASTITQQLAKNLWLGEERSLWRKLREVVLARRLESLGKERILELYLNVVEWGAGIYGAEAAAQSWFHKPAAQLEPEEAAVLAAMLPAPRKRNPRKPSLKLIRRAAEVVDLYGEYGQLRGADLDAARARVKSLLPVQ
jgi:monofunctional biosynthetic peptidoglycan transglycosylase